MSILKVFVFVVLAIGVVYAGYRYNLYSDAQNAQALLLQQEKEAEAARALLAKLIVKDEVEGSGQPVESGDTVTVHYVGILEDGKKFDSSYDRSEPFTFVVGKGLVIEGWDKGILGMKVGGRRILTIPPELGYADQANQYIPANSTLHFTVDLVDVKKP